jgi:hypothetical protein
MSTFSIKDPEIDVESIMNTIRKRIEEKRRGLYTEEEVREIAQMKLDAVLDAHEFNSDFAAAFRARDAKWNFSFTPDTLYASSRGFSGSLIRLARRIANPVLKLFFNPNPIISALSRQSDLNRYYLQLLHNLAAEVTKMNLELTELKTRTRGLTGRMDFQVRRERALEELTTGKVKEKEPAAAAGEAGEAANRKRGRGRRGWRRRRPRPENGERIGDAKRPTGDGPGGEPSADG